jgi:hypothetical protein
MPSRPKPADAPAAQAGLAAPSSAVLPRSAPSCLERAKSGELCCHLPLMGHYSERRFARGPRTERPEGSARYLPLVVAPKERGVKSGLSIKPPTDDLEPINYLNPAHGCRALAAKTGRFGCGKTDESAIELTRPSVPHSRSKHRSRALVALKRFHSLYFLPTAKHTTACEANRAFDGTSFILIHSELSDWREVLPHSGRRELSACREPRLPPQQTPLAGEPGLPPRLPPQQGPLAGWGLRRNAADPKLRTGVKNKP